MNNFENTGGTIFFVESPKLIPDRTYLVVSSKFLRQHHPLRLLENATSNIDSSIIGRITRARARFIQKSWPIATLDTIGKVVVVWFEDQGASPLASLVVARSDSLIFEDYVGNRSDESSVWRVDDGGEFFGEDIRVIAAFSSPDGIALARIWVGAEGENEEFLQQSKDRFVLLMNDYRYRVPE